MRKPTIDEISYNLNKDKNKRELPPPEYQEVMELFELIYDNTDDTVKPINSSRLNKFSYNTIQWILHTLGLYTFPTTEVIEFLKSEIPDLSKTIEIGAGLGWISKTLGIRGTDLKLQNRYDIREIYELHNQPTINYPEWIEEIDAHEAIRIYKPTYVIGSYITDKTRNVYGVNNVWVANNCRKYIMIGNENIHSKDPVMKRKFKRVVELPGLITRGDSTKAKIWVFESKCY